jgi:hypothetical protein
MMGMTPPPPVIYANHDSDDEDDSDDEAGCGGVRYDRDRVDKKMKTPAKINAPINLKRNMASKFFNWECILPFNTSPRAEEKTSANFLDLIHSSSCKTQALLVPWPFRAWLLMSLL